MLLECGGKRSATPLSDCDSLTKSAVAASLCRRTPGRPIARGDQRASPKSHFLGEGQSVHVPLAASAVLKIDALLEIGKVLWEC
jgi:hypothetical protein